MFMSLVAKELKYQLKSVTFYLFFAIVLLFYFTQFAPPSPKDTLKPALQNIEAQGSSANTPYGFTYEANPEGEMKSLYSQMYRDLESGEFLSYKGFIGKHVRLSEAQKIAVEKAMKEIAPEGYKDGQLKINVTYESFLEIMRKLDKDLGGSTLYSDDNRKMLSQRPMTYEESLADFQEILEKDRLTNAYGRYFADYMGITAGFFPVFLAAFLLTRDRRSRMHELINSRQVSSLMYVSARFIALAAVVLLCYLIPATHATYVFQSIASANHYVIDLFAFYKYTLFWILPTILFTISTGMLVSTVFGNGIAAIPVQFLLWMSSMLPLQGEYGLLKSVIRFNELGGYEQYMKWIGAIQANRAFYSVVSIVIVIITSYIWSMKRGAGDAGFSGLFKRISLQR